jgi:hypothetical protein
MGILTRFLGILVLCLAPAADIAIAKVRVGIAAEAYPPFLVKDASGENPRYSCTGQEETPSQSRK